MGGAKIYEDQVEYLKNGCKSLESVDLYLKGKRQPISYQEYCKMPHKLKYK